MNASLLPTLAAALALTVTTPVFAQDTETPATAETVVASVNGVDITLGHLILAKSQLPQQYQQIPAEALFEGLVDQLVQQALLSEQVTDVPRRVGLAMENQRRSLLAGEILQDIVESAVTEEALQEAYNARFADAEPELEYNANHILVETEEEALALITELEGGADFETLAKEKSTGPSGPNGGALGWFGKGMMVPEFEGAVVDMSAGEFAGPVQTQFGFHVILLNETRTKDAPSLEELRPELTGELQRAAIDAEVEALKDGAEITIAEPGSINPELLNDLSLLDPQ